MTSTHTFNNSNSVISNQSGLHENLQAIVRKHFETEYKKPIAEHTQIAFDTLKNRIEKERLKDTPLLFDSFCGTGMSTVILAKRNPDALVIGIDRSIARLSKSTNHELAENAVLVQAECADFWKLAVNAGWKLCYHSIYYPNPYPKAKHIKRRWHAHPAYPLLFLLGGDIELRTNWKIYANEFYQAFLFASHHLKHLTYQCKGVDTLTFNSLSEENKADEIEFMTLFEKKYFLSDQTLYSCKLTSN